VCLIRIRAEARRISTLAEGRFPIRESSLVKRELDDPVIFFTRSRSFSFTLRCFQGTDEQDFAVVSRCLLRNRFAASFFLPPADERGRRSLNNNNNAVASDATVRAICRAFSRTRRADFRWSAALFALLIANGRKRERERAVSDFRDRRKSTYRQGRQVELTSRSLVIEDTCPHAWHEITIPRAHACTCNPSWVTRDRGSFNPIIILLYRALDVARLCCALLRQKVLPRIT